MRWRPRTRTSTACTSWPTVRRRGSNSATHRSLNPACCYLPSKAEPLSRVRLGPTDLPGAEGHAAPAPVRAAVDGMLAAGCPRAKLVLGLPFYGRSLEQPGRLTLSLTLTLALTLTSNRNQP